MLTLVIGGAASGKSAYAESLTLKLPLPRYYVATMQVWDEECAKRVEKHRAMRKEKQFETIESPISIDKIRIPNRGIVLLEDLGNLTANELYDPKGAGVNTAEAVLYGVEILHKQCEHLIVVGNEVFSGGAEYADETDLYLKALAQIQNGIAARADHVCRVVCGIPVYYKGGGKGMTILQTIAVAFAMFSAIPMPQFEWSQKNMRYALCAFPLIGAVCGGLWCLAGVLPVPELVRAAGFCLVPVLVTGGIHLDGFADTCDALSSYGDAEKKLEILKDPHCGAFAVIRLCTYFILYFALCASVKFTVRFGVIWILALTLERAFSGLAVASFPMAKNTGLAHTFSEAANRITVRRVLIIYTVVLGAAMIVLGGWAAVLAVLLVFRRYYAVSKKQFGGITGDLAGWFLQRAELAMLAALAVCQWGGIL